MDAVEVALKRLQQLDGLVDASIIAVPSGEVLGCVSGPDGAAQIVAAAATDVLRAVALMTVLHPDDGPVEDVVISLEQRYHLVRPLGDDDEKLLLLVSLDRARTNLALARRQLRDAEADLAS